jgi:hypothetical protein
MEKIGKREMKVKDLIAALLERNGLEDEIIVEWFDKKHFTDDLGLNNLFDVNIPSNDELDKVWPEVVKQGQEILSSLVISYETEYEIGEVIVEIFDENDEDNE